MTNPKPFLSNAFRNNIAVVYYHDNCPDGALSAMIAFVALNASCDRQVWTVPVKYDDKVLVPQLPHATKGLTQKLDLYFVDFCPSPWIVRDLMRDQVYRPQVASITIVDHHAKTYGYMNEFEKIMTEPSDTLVEVHFANNKSGAMLTYEFFQEALGDSAAKYRQLAAELNTYDLWLHEGRNASRAAKAAVGIAALYAEAKKAANVGEYYEKVSELFTGASSTQLPMEDAYKAAMMLARKTTSVIAELTVQSVPKIINKGREKIKDNEEKAKAAAEGGILVPIPGVASSIKDTQHPAAYLIVHNVRAEHVNEVGTQAALVYPNVAFTVCLNMEHHGKVSLRHNREITIFKPGEPTGQSLAVDMNVLAGLIEPPRDGKKGGGGHTGSAGAHIHIPVTETLNEAQVRAWGDNVVIKAVAVYFEQLLQS